LSPSGHAGGEAPAAPEPALHEPAREGASGAVGVGYRVIEEYLQQGRRAAEALGLDPSGSPAAGSSFQSLTARLFGDALVWLEHLARLTTAPADEGARSASSAAGDAAPATGFRVRVAGAAPLDVDLQIRAGTEGRALGVHDLRSTDSETPPLRGVELVHAERWQVVLRVPGAQPAGLYTGIVYDRSDGSICGTLAVRVGPAGGTR
jgi:hypothetical protein